MKVLLIGIWVENNDCFSLSEDCTTLPTATHAKRILVGKRVALCGAPTEILVVQNDVVIKHWRAQSLDF